MSSKIFITGTDTNIGKTYIAIGILKALKKAGFATIGLKPIASGAKWQNGILINDDAYSLNQASTFHLQYEQTNPILYEKFISPNIAAQELNQTLNLKTLYDKTNYIFKFPTDVFIVEGIGGWEVPLNETEKMKEFVIHHQMAVVLVVGIKLGCINHSILTYESLRKDNVKILGWIANCCDNTTEMPNEIIRSIQDWLPIPLIGKVAYNQAPENIFHAKYYLSYIHLQIFSSNQ